MRKTLALLSVLGCLTASVVGPSVASAEVLPANVTGGGQVLNEFTFALEFHQGLLEAPQGNCLVLDRNDHAKVKCVGVDVFETVPGVLAVMGGTAEVDGVVQPYQMLVIDVNDSGAGADLLFFTSGAFTIADTLDSGNIQVH